jgi:hypothetical protein
MNFYPFNDIETISPRPMIFMRAQMRTLESSAKRPAKTPLVCGIHRYGPDSIRKPLTPRDASHHGLADNLREK